MTAVEGNPSNGELLVTTRSTRMTLESYDQNAAAICDRSDTAARD